MNMSLSHLPSCAATDDDGLAAFFVCMFLFAVYHGNKQRNQLL